MKRNIKLTIEYDGSGYAGWQRQPDAITVQEVIEKALRKINSGKTTLYSAGRTDAGVHATGQTANFFTEGVLPAHKYRDALNFYLPDDILIVSTEEVSNDFHSRYDAILRRYHYDIGWEQSLVNRNKCWILKVKLNQARLEKAAEYIRGEHDFTAFCVVSSQKKNNRCLVYQSYWKQNKGFFRYNITADRFLHTMIRSLMGFMVEFARGGISFRKFREIFHSGDHTMLPRVAPARGLTLAEVDY